MLEQYNENISNEFKMTVESLIKTIDRIPVELFNRNPFTGSWSAQQVSEHLLRSAEIVLSILVGDTKPLTGGRKPDENVSALMNIFLDFESKFDSPEFIMPGRKSITKTFVIDSTAQIADKIKNIIVSEDLSLICIDKEFPQIGELTRYEWVNFVIFHTRRHTRQINNIYSKLTGSKTIPVLSLLTLY